jgi:anti-sigma28 factor (negative regulator of flagellin synthesis)
MKLSGEEFLRVSQIGPERVGPRNIPAMGVITTARLRPAGSDNVVSSDYADAHRVAQNIDQESDIREDIVASLRERVEAGTYLVSGEQVAEMMIRRMMADRVR